ncbi:MAG: isoprenyl transferase [Candidatus Sumerlaeota bacterium]|nr:isoprenyl transferase [Candidatus Sumerlaeota bacterium]
MTLSEQELFQQLDKNRLPRHVAIIMDGNGRWARLHGFKSRMSGHRAGIDAVRTATRTAAELNLHALTLYAFSEENWSRPKREIQFLMSLLRRFLKDEIPELMENNIRLVSSGHIRRLPDDCRMQLLETQKITQKNTGLILNLALSYGGRTEIADAVRKIATDAAAGKIHPDDITEERFAAFLYHPELPDPDLIIRTSGEYRISNFLLWQAAYAELYFTNVLWPDFNKRIFLEALIDYQKRERRFGGV